MGGVGLLLVCALVSTLSDIRHAFCLWGRTPAVTLIATLAIAIGAGAAAIVFAAVKTVLIEPFPYSHAEALVQIRTDAGRGGSPQQDWVSWDDMRDVARENHSFSALGTYHYALFNLGGDPGSLPEALYGLYISASVFPTLGPVSKLVKQVDLVLFYTCGVVNHKDIRRRFRSLAAFLDERMRRLVAAAESEAVGYGGISAVARATGVSRRAITEGMKELNRQTAARGMRSASSRIRRKGAGRKRTIDRDPTLLADLDRLVDPTTRGDPESPLRWTCKSVRTLAEELQREGHAVSYQTVAEVLHAMDYSLQANQKTLEGSQHADRDQQFEYINRKAQRYLKQGEPVISVDTKKKELVGDLKNGGREWQPKGEPEPVRVHDFEIREPGKGKVAPYGVYDLGRNVGWVSVGVDHDTAAFAVESIRRWWRWMGRPSYPQARRLLITADSGGSNGARVRLWKWELQQLADETGLEVSVCHFPPGTSKWNKIEHRLFSFISQNWRGRPLISHEVIINLIAATTTTTGLAVKSKLDTNVYPAGVKVSDQQMAELQLRRDRFHGDWNYSLLPRS